MSKPLHDHTKNRDGLYITVIHSDQFTNELLEAYPHFEELDFIYEIRTSNGFPCYRVEIEEVEALLDLASSGRGALQRVLQEGTDPCIAKAEAKSEWEAWQARFDYFRDKPKHAKATDGLDDLLDDLDLENLV